MTVQPGDSLAGFGKFQAIGSDGGMASPTTQLGLQQNGIAYATPQPASTSDRFALASTGVIRDKPAIAPLYQPAPAYQPPALRS